MAATGVCGDELAIWVLDSRAVQQPAKLLVPALVGDTGFFVLGELEDGADPGDVSRGNPPLGRGQRLRCRGWRGSGRPGAGHLGRDVGGGRPYRTLRLELRRAAHHGAGAPGRGDCRRNVRSHRPHMGRWLRWADLAWMPGRYLTAMDHGTLHGDHFLSEAPGPYREPGGGGAELDCDAPDFVCWVFQKHYDRLDLSCGACLRHGGLLRLGRGALTPAASCSFWSGESSACAVTH